MLTITEKENFIKSHIDDVFDVFNLNVESYSFSKHYGVNFKFYTKSDPVEVFFEDETLAFMKYDSVNKYYVITFNSDISYKYDLDDLILYVLATELKSITMKEKPDVYISEFGYALFTGATDVMNDKITKFFDTYIKMRTEHMNNNYRILLDYINISNNMIDNFDNIIEYFNISYSVTEFKNIKLGTNHFISDKEMYINTFKKIHRLYSVADDNEFKLHISINSNLISDEYLCKEIVIYHLIQIIGKKILFTDTTSNTKNLIYDDDYYRFRNKTFNESEIELIKQFIYEYNNYYLFVLSDEQ